MADVLQKEMFEYFALLNEAEKQSVIQMLKTFLKRRGDSIDRIGLEQYNKEIAEAMEEARLGEVYSHDEVIKMLKDW